MKCWLTFVPRIDQTTFDLLAIYMVRSIGGSTIVVYYPPFDIKFTPPLLESHRWFALMSREPHWDEVISGSRKDSPILFFPILWYLVYAWSDVLEKLYLYIDALVRC
jgi:hypothetical protein